MAEWIYDRSGRPQIIVDDNRFLDRSGNKTVGWIEGAGTFTLAGQHAGWFEDGVLSDLQNQWAGFTEDAAAEIPSRPEITQTRPMPEIGKRPTRPDFEDIPTPPEKSCAFSTVPLDYFFDEKKPLAPSFYEDIQGA
jgi:hypothetical protein